MRISRAVVVLSAALLLATVGSVAAATYELDVVATPARQEVFWPFRARLDVYVRDAVTHKPVDRALVHVLYSTQKTDGTPVGGAYYKKTIKNGHVRFSFPLGQDFIGQTFNFEIRVDHGSEAGYTEASVDVTD